ncbi:hypothetical protein GIB67_028480 [Kingdonia uniflora]|uniref:Uncharacterized protein n=1 Tax=Kingdonia uniflora TaxID=39325 RepID=A0A7J7P1S4_9MAGN|nr:hypothetical protein GIB67_028480 [Kingdonia uniflora]
MLFIFLGEWVIEDEPYNFPDMDEFAVMGMYPPPPVPSPQPPFHNQPQEGTLMLNHRKLWKPFLLIQGKTLVHFELIILKKHKGTFSHIDNKKMPAALDCFGWCTWDAFYTEVNPQGDKGGT